MENKTNKTKNILWMEDQYEELYDYSRGLIKKGYRFDSVKSVSGALGKLKTGAYGIYVFDLKVLPGDDPEWQKLDEELRGENVDFDSYLGLELLRFLHREKEAQSETWQDIKFNFKRVIVFSVVANADIRDELEGYGVPVHQ
ncbi:MAG: hypothetical protein GY950_28740, partial [bacterium]|nr:hypothetical protein [bacterium]